MKQYWMTDADLVKSSDLIPRTVPIPPTALASFHKAAEARIIHDARYKLLPKTITSGVYPVAVEGTAGYMASGLPVKAASITDIDVLPTKSAGANDATNAPAWLPDYTKGVWARENAAKTGFDPKTKTWSTYKDMNQGKAKRSAIGPGVIVPPGTEYTQEEMDNAVKAQTLEHWNRARELYAGLDKQDPRIQQFFTDVTYAGAGEYPKAWAAVQAKDPSALIAQHKVHYTPPGGTLTENTRRNIMNREEWLNPVIKQWAAPPTPTATSSAPQPKPIAPQPKPIAPQPKPIAPTPAAPTLTAHQKSERDAAIAANNAELARIRAGASVASK